jgi:hypothetical protein
MEVRIWIDTAVFRVGVLVLSLMKRAGITPIVGIGLGTYIPKLQGIAAVFSEKGMIRTRVDNR